MAVIGRGPQRHAEFVEKTTMLRAYLRGDSYRIGDWDSRLEWLSDFPDYQPVPLEIMGSGPKTLRTAGALADRITLAVGAAPERIDWALERVDEGLADSGRTRADVTLGSTIALCIDDDRQRAAERLRQRVRAAAHMSSFPGNDLDAQPEIMRRITTELRTGYDYAQHHMRKTAWEEGEHPQELIDAEFAGWFGVGGPAPYVVERLHALVEQGFRYFIFAAQSLEERQELMADVVPQVRKLAVAA